VSKVKKVKVENQVTKAAKRIKNGVLEHGINWGVIRLISR
jgi:hypothetical protein